MICAFKGLAGVDFLSWAPSRESGKAVSPFTGKTADARVGTVTPRSRPEAHRTSPRISFAQCACRTPGLRPAPSSQVRPVSGSGLTAAILRLPGEEGAVTLTGAVSRAERRRLRPLWCVFTWRRDPPADTAAPALLFLKSPAAGADWPHGVGGGARPHCLGPAAGCPGGRTGPPRPAGPGLGPPGSLGARPGRSQVRTPGKSRAGSRAGPREPAPLRVPRRQEPLLTPGHPAPRGLGPPTARIGAAPDPLAILLGSPSASRPTPCHSLRPRARPPVRGRTPRSFRSPRRKDDAPGFQTWGPTFLLHPHPHSPREPPGTGLRDGGGPSSQQRGRRRSRGT